MMMLNSSVRGKCPVALRLVVAASAICLVAACGGASTPDSHAAATKKAAKPAFASTRLQPPVLRAGHAVPLSKDPILAVEGKISATNDGHVLRLGVDTLDQLGVLKVNTYEPWAKKRMSFQGMWLADMLKVAGIDQSARTVHFTALDDYQVDLTMTEIAKGGIFLATKSADGSPIPIDQGGPTRIVFMDGVTAGASADQWVWSLKDINVK
jgi:hypothetical protein